MIKNVSSTFKANCKKDSVKYREYIIIDNKEVDIKGNLSDTAYKDDTFFGKFNLKMLKFETENDIDYKKKEFTYYKEVDGEALKIGTFIVTDVSDSDTFESVNVTAYDYGLKFANPYTTSLDYSSGSITLFQVIQEICTNCGVELENISLPNGTFIVDSNQFVNGEKNGDVVAQASGINGMFATINSNDKLEFIFTNETDEIIEDYVQLDDKRDKWPITSVLVAISEDLETAGAVMKDDTLIEQYGEHWLKIYSYGFAYSTIKCQQLVEAIFNQVKGFGYSSFKSEYSFLPYLTLGDKIKFKNKEGKLVDSIILRYETNYDEMVLEAPSIISASVEYELPETPAETSKKALVKVDQANGEIELIAKDIGELNSKTAQLSLDVDKIEGDYTEIKTTVDGQTTEIGTIKGDVTTIKESIDGLQLSITKSGNNLIRNSMFYDFEGWSEINSFRIARQDTPPTDITITNLWYCTKTSEYYENGKIYSGISGEEGIAWVLTDLLLSDLTKTNSGKPPVTFHIVSNAEIRQEYKSGSCLQIIVPEGYRNEYSLYSDIIDINNIEDTLTFSVRGIDKNEELANFSIRLWLYNDVNNLYKYIHIPIYETELPKQRGIIKNSFKIPRSTTTFNAVESNTEPTDTSQLWLKPLSDNTYSLYEYKDTWVLKQGQGVMAKDQNDTLYLPYGLSSMFSALKDSNGNKLNSFIPTQGFVELNYVRSAENVDNIVNVELGDMKLEYGEYSEWSPKRTEVVGTNHLLDETGYKISSGDDVMRIMIDEIAQYYKNTKMFYLNKTEGYIKNVISETSNIDGLITTSITVGGNKIYGRYIK